MWMKNIYTLGKNVTLFPDLNQAILCGLKLFTIQSLSEIARTIINIGYPWIVMVENIKNEKTLGNKNIVFKRGYSDATELV
jgi:hypothetical protein